jgi:hypothetical protein
MAFIQTVSETEATGKLRELYSSIISLVRLGMRY